MARPPRRRDAPILSGELVWHVVLVALLFLAAVFGIFTYAIDKGYPLALGADHGDEHAGGAGDLPPLLHPQHPQHLVDLGRGARDESGLDRGHRHHRRAIRRHLSAAFAGGAGNKARAA